MENAPYRYSAKVVCRLYLVAGRLFAENGRKWFDKLNHGVAGKIVHRKDMI